MLKHKHYMDIQNMNYEIGVKFHEGDDIIIQEKVDGANASFQYNSEDDCLDCFSRNQPLSPENDLRGFYQWVQNLDKNKVHEVLGDNLRMFGEWLVPHTVPYPKERYNRLYCFDVSNIAYYKWMAIAKNLGATIHFFILCTGQALIRILHYNFNADILQSGLLKVLKAVYEIILLALNCRKTADSYVYRYV